MEATWQTRGTAGHEAHGQWAVYDDKGRDVAIVYDGPKHAHKLAAAPALLEACKAVQRDIDGFIMGEWESSEDGWKALSDRLYAAIRQAEGGGE